MGEEGEGFINDSQGGARLRQSSSTAIGAGGWPLHRQRSGLALRFYFQTALPFRCNLFPAFAYDFFHAVWHGHIVHPVGHFVAIAIRPVKELKRFGRLLGLVGFFVHQDKRGTGNRPAVLARLIGQDLVEAIGGFPVGVGGRFKAVIARLNKATGCIFKRGVGNFVFAWRRRIPHNQSHPLIRVT